MTTTGTFFTWKEEYSVYNAEIDVQHKRLVKLLNTLYDDMLAGKGGQHLSDVLSDLVRYTQEHFRDEEALMQRNQYPAYKIHKQAHEDLARQVSEFQQKLRSGRVTLSVDLLQFLKSWLKNHIRGSDQEFGRYLTMRKQR